MFQESSVQVYHRFCLCDPSVKKFKMLAFCDALYHSCVNDLERIQNEGLPNSSQVLQLRAADLARHSFDLVGG